MKSVPLLMLDNWKVSCVEPVGNESIAAIGIKALQTRRQCFIRHYVGPVIRLDENNVLVPLIAYSDVEDGSGQKAKNKILLIGHVSVTTSKFNEVFWNSIASDDFRLPDDHMVPRLYVIDDEKQIGVEGRIIDNLAVQIVKEQIAINVIIDKKEKFKLPLNLMNFENLVLNDIPYTYDQLLSQSDSPWLNKGYAERYKERRYQGEKLS